MKTQNHSFQSSFDTGGEIGAVKWYLMNICPIKTLRALRIVCTIDTLIRAIFFNEREVLDDFFLVQENLQPLFEDFR